MTALAAVEESLARIEELDPAINAFTVVTADAALARAREVDAGRVTGPLAGRPISVKDHVWVRGLPATNGSRALADHVAAEDCDCVTRLLGAGAVIVGKTNNPEFCYRGVTENELFGVTRNPRDLSRTTGGSSGGAAASVAAGMVPLAVGTDGGGSIRIPSAFCGTAGIKPSHALVPTMPGFLGWPSLSVTGPIAASVADLVVALSVMAHQPLPTAPDDLSWDGIRVAVSPDLGFADVDDDVRSVFEDVVADLPTNPHRAHPTPMDPTSLWDDIALPEGYASEGTLVEAHPDLVGDDAAAIALAGRGYTEQDRLEADHRRADLVRAWDAFWEDHDVLLTPTMPCTAFATGRLAPPTLAGRPVPAAFDAWCALALPANLTGMPAVSVPIGVGADGLPVGLQVMARRSDDATALRVAALVERRVSLPGPIARLP